MKKILSLITVFILSIGFVLAQSKGPEITFEKKDLTYDFGKVKFNSKAEYKFIFKNTGDRPLVITNAESGCGCTTPVWPKTAIMPGKSDGITVGYKTDTKGPIDKIITVKTNAGKEVQLRITGEVI